MSHCNDCKYVPCACVLLETVRLGEARSAKAVAEAERYRLLWQAAASLITYAGDKLKPRGQDERRLIDIAKHADHGRFWSGKTDGWQ